jgi:hypothetical protein
MQGTEPKTTDTKKTPPTPTRGESAVRHLWKRAQEEDRTEDAKLIATVANHLMPSIKLSDGLPFDAKKAKAKVDSTATVDGQPVDLTEMADSDAEAYAAYAKEMDGSAALERHIARLEEEDAETREIFGARDGS